MQNYYPSVLSINRPDIFHLLCLLAPLFGKLLLKQWSSKYQPLCDVTKGTDVVATSRSNKWSLLAGGFKQNAKYANIFFFFFFGGSPSVRHYWDPINQTELLSNFFETLPVKPFESQTESGTQVYQKQTYHFITFHSH